MLIDNTSMVYEVNSIAEPVALFLFAHQDDEFGVFQKILDEKENGRRVFCVYLTDGAFKGSSSKKRDSESLSVLKRLGVFEQDVIFIGNALSIPDAGLSEYMEVMGGWLQNKFSEFLQLTSIYTPAWEGGHPDHDVLHAITVCITEKSGLINNVRQFSLYNGYKCYGRLFKVLSPLPMNGLTEEVKISWKLRLLFLRLCLSYPSQAITWIGIFPFVVFNYLVKGKQVLQPVSIERIGCRPHDGELYYESRGFVSWEKISDKINCWQSTLSA